MDRHQHKDLIYYKFAGLDVCAELQHGITTRHGGISRGPYATLNLTKNGDDAAAVEENLARACAALAVRREDLVSPNQRHTANVRRVDRDDRGRVLPGYDALITDQAGVPLLLRYADCVPVLIYDPCRHAIGLVHSGWRGTVLGITRATVTAMTEAYGCRPADMIAAVGPSIGPCCYEVGQEVVDAVLQAFRMPDEPARGGNELLAGGPGRRHLDLWAANALWLREAGVGQVELASICTACHRDEFFSYRASKGTTGHFGAIMQLKG
jgi:hypothetical protein